MTFGRLQIQPGMAVVEPAGTMVGRVTRVEDEEFMVGRLSGDELTVPYTKIRALVGNEVIVDMSS
jgi:hypothetical protein